MFFFVLFALFIAIMIALTTSMILVNNSFAGYSIGLGCGCSCSCSFDTDEDVEDVTVPIHTIMYEPCPKFGYGGQTKDDVIF